ncbi:DUF5050 domain-containing protein [Acetobacterium paludosum]|uniref:DUF5050 domain-containing protein n=1 Tax=Acetobacterium paludosum TaxID=52693 RepID=A0A923HT38_9FIRM|nr:DUF5050 domain-containing protein [Acetobacterium paludosum]
MRPHGHSLRTAVVANKRPRFGWHQPGGHGIGCFAGGNDGSQHWALSFVKNKRRIRGCSASVQHFERRMDAMKKIIWALLCCAVSVIVFSGCSTASNRDSGRTNSETAVNTIGNTGGNIANWGYAALQGDWIYYSDQNDNGKLDKIKTDGSGKIKLSAERTAYLNVVGDWIYFTDFSDQNRLAKIRTDGSEKTVLTDEGAFYLNVIGDWIYYSGSGLTKIKTDGSEKTILSDDRVSIINVVADWIYYCRPSPEGEKFGGAIYKIKTDGSEKTKLCDDAASIINATDDWIYYCYTPATVEKGTTRGFGDFGELYKIRTDGTEKTKLSSDRAAYINVVGDWIYYADDGDNDKLYKIKTDGTEKNRLFDDVATRINVVGDWIYYDHGYFGMYQIKTDGSGRHRVQ